MKNVEFNSVSILQKKYTSLRLQISGIGGTAWCELYSNLVILVHCITLAHG